VFSPYQIAPLPVSGKPVRKKNASEIVIFFLILDLSF